VDEEVRRRVQTLIKQGELAEPEGNRLLDRLLALSHPAQAQEPDLQQQELLKEIEGALTDRGVPTRADFEDLLEQLDRLEDKLDELGRPLP
jgi:polyhydroxyalkanoate synthesis regulator phasin